MIEFEQSSYEFLEDIERNNLAARVCVKILSLPVETNINIVTVSGSAQGIVYNVSVNIISVHQSTYIPRIKYTDVIYGWNLVYLYEFIV